MKNTIKYTISLFTICISLFSSAQIPIPPVMVDGSQPWTAGSINITNTDKIVYYNSTTLSANLTLNPSKEVRLQPGAIAGNFNSQGGFHAYVSPSSIDVVSFNPNGWENIPKYERFELGVKLPTNIQSMIDNFLNGLSGINPYDPSQIQVECSFNNGAYTRYGFYYRNFITQNNMWIEQPTDYKFRIRIAPEQVVSNKAIIKIYVQGVLIETLERYFQAMDNNDPGHLNVSSNGNLLKLQHSNGKMFFGVGQNIPYAIGLNNAPCRDMTNGSCACPDSYENQRSYLNDLANNGGNFTRIRIQSDNNAVEWSYRPLLTTDPDIDLNIPLSKYLNNYDVNQRYMWEMDKTFKVMEDRGIYAILSLLNDQNYSMYTGYTSDSAHTWKGSPYSSILGKDLNACKNFFSDATAKSYYKKQLYYIMARWGYSKSLAIWQLINETANVANNIAGGSSHMIENDATFSSQVANWVCEMQYYLQQYYPLKPVNTGFVSDKPLKNIIDYSCQNVWSSNLYVTHIDEDKHYRDEDFNARASPSINSYFPSGKPFFWGELGMGDGINFIDAKSDRSFHNAIWASTFTGGISNGLYWKDWEQNFGINHRYNFRALRAFTDMIDFSQRLEPYKEFAKLNGKEIKTWWMRNTAKNYIVGWTKNNSANWTQELSGFSINDQQTIMNRIQYSAANVESSYITYSNTFDPPTKITGLLPSTSYKIKIYNTYDNANEIEVKTEYSDLNGTLTFKRTMYPYINDPFNPDYAFIIKPNSSWKVANNEVNITDTVYASTEDTIKLSSAYISKKSDYKYSWNNNSYSKQDSTLFVNYANEGVYNLNMEAKNLRTDTVIRHNFILLVSNKNLEKALNDVSVYPVPANNYVNVFYNSDIIKNPSITCTDILGKNVEISQQELYKFDVSHLKNGVYFIKFEYSRGQKTFKINVIH